jgi:hypothetical protein
LFREILDARLELKEQADAATDEAEAKRLKTQADGLKIVLNSTFGQLGNYPSILYDPESMLMVTLTGQLLLINLLEDLAACGARIIATNTDGVIFSARTDDAAWQSILGDWEARTGMTLEATPLQTVALAATNNFATVTTAGKVKRRGTLGNPLDWQHVPKFPIVADAVAAALLQGTLPEETVRQCQDPFKFTAVVRRRRKMEGAWIDQDAGTEEPAARLVRFYKARGSLLKLEHRWTSEDGKVHKMTPSNATEIRPLMDLPETLPVDLQVTWYASEARRRILKHVDFPHLDPKWLEDHAAPKRLHDLGLCPVPKWDGKNLPAGAITDRPSYFWPWADYKTFGTFTGPLVNVLVLDIDDFEKFGKWVDNTNDPIFMALWRTLDGALTSYHRKDTAEAVRSGHARGKLVFRFAAAPDHKLAKMSVGRWKKTRGVEVFFGKGCPTVLGSHPDGRDHDYLLDGALGEAPAWLVDGLTPKTKSLRKRRKIDPETNGEAVLDEAASRVASLPEGEQERHSGLIQAALQVGPLVAAGIVDQDQAEKTLVDASTLPRDESREAIRWAFEKTACDGSSNGTGRGVAGLSSTPESLVPKRRIEVNTELGRIRDEILSLLPDDPDLYRRGDVLVRLVQIETPTYKLRGGAELKDTVGMHAIVPLDVSSFACRLTMLADFIRWDKIKDGEEVEVPVCPPGIPVRAVLNNVAYPGVRAIEGVVEVPYFRRDGTLCPPGYDPETGIIYIPSVAFDPLPDPPTQEDARDAAKRLLQFVSDFPFDTDEDRAVWLAAVFTMVARPMIPGPVPGIAFIGNKAGIGKGKLVTATGLIATGRTVPTTMYPLSKEETTKTKVSLGLSAATAVFFDNLEEGSTYGNGPLDSSITEPAMNERLLTTNKMTGDIELRPCWFLSGNNIAPGKDAYRRWFVCNLKSLLENPEERDDITIKDLNSHILEHRGELLRDVLIVLKAHAVANRPTNKWAPLGSFEHWDRIIRGAVWFATGWDCNKSRKAAAAESPDRLKKIALLEAWDTTPGGSGAGMGLTVAAAYARATERDEKGNLIHPKLHAAFMAFSKDGNMPSQDSIGRWISSIKDSVFKGKKIIKAGTDCGSTVWNVVPCEQSAEK